MTKPAAQTINPDHTAKNTYLYCVKITISLKALFFFFLLLPLWGGAQQPVLELVGRFPTDSLSGFDIWAYQDTATGREFALLGSKGIVIVDVTDAKNPVLASYLPNVSHFDVKVYKQYAYTVNGGPNGFGHVIDLTDPYTPIVADSFPSAHNIWIDEQGYLYAEYSGLKIYALEPDPLNPLLLFSGGAAGQGHDCFNKGNILYDFHGMAGTNIWDVTDRQNPVLINNISKPEITYHHSGWVTEDSDYLYICDELATGPSPDITIWDITDVMNPTQVGEVYDSTATVHNLYIIGNYAYVAYYSAGFKIFDISDPVNPQLAAQYDTHADAAEGYKGAFGAYVFSPSGNLYVHDRDSGLFIFRFSLPPDTFPEDTTPKGQEGLFCTPNPASGQVTVEFRYATTTSLLLRLYAPARDLPLVWEEKVQRVEGFYKHTYDFSALASGAYILQALTGSDAFWQKIVIVRSGE